MVPLLQENFVPSLLTPKRSEGGGKYFGLRVILVPLLQKNFVPSLLGSKRSEGGGLFWYPFYKKILYLPY